MLPPAVVTSPSRGGMVATVIAILGSGLTGDFVAQLGLRTVAGVGGAMIFICGAVLASNIFPDRPRLASSAIAVYFGGAGAGILLSGAGVPPLLAIAGDDAWRSAWLAIGIVSALFAAFAIWAARQIDEPSSGARGGAWPIAELRAALASYFLFGAGYIAYMTFVVAWMVSHGRAALDVSLTWGTLGIATLVAPLAWRVPRARWRAATVLAASGVVLGIGAALAAGQHFAPCDADVGSILWGRDVHRTRGSDRSRQDVAAQDVVGLRGVGVHRRLRDRPGNRARSDRLACRCHPVAAGRACRIGGDPRRCERNGDASAHRLIESRHMRIRGLAHRGGTSSGTTSLRYVAPRCRYLWTNAIAMQNQFAKYKINFVPAHPDVAVEPSLAAVLKGANIFAIDAAYAGANRKKIVDRWVAEVLNP